MGTSIRNLYGLLQGFAVLEGSQQYELYRALEENKSRLVALLDVGPKNASERQQVQSGA